MNFRKFWSKSTSQKNGFQAREKKAIHSIPTAPFHVSLEKNTGEITKLLGHSGDFGSCQLTYRGRAVRLFYLKSLVDTDRINRQLVLSLERDDLNKEVEMLGETEEGEEANALSVVREQIISAAETIWVDDWRLAVQLVLNGFVLLLVDGEPAGLGIEVKKVAKRSILPPETEQSVIGPRESFIENLEVNISLIRQRLRDPFLRVELSQVGERAIQNIAIMYLADVANPQIVKEVEKRLSSIPADAVIGQMQLQEYLEDNTISLFPQIRPTERPDVTCSYLLEGSVAVMIDGAVHALILPMSLMQLLDTVDDYYSSWQYSTLIRFVRLTALFFSITTPGLYLSLVAFNPELIPTRLLISMDAARAMVAFPIILEIFIMEIMIEILREAGIKLPRPIGQAVSIIGGLVIGEAAVNARLVSPITVVIVALTAISSFTAPMYSLGITLRILRIFLLFCSGMFGLYGFMLGMFLIHAHLARIVTFGVPYLAPLSPLRLRDWADTLVRFPYKTLTQRPGFLHTLKKKKSRSRPLISDEQRKK